MEPANISVEVSPENIKRKYNTKYYNKNRDRLIKIVKESNSAKPPTTCQICNCDVKNMSAHNQTYKHRITLFLLQSNVKFE
jgi:hypothetical protein